MGESHAHIRRRQILVPPTYAQMFLSKATEFGEVADSDGAGVCLQWVSHASAPRGQGPSLPEFTLYLR